MGRADERTLAPLTAFSQTGESRPDSVELTGQPSDPDLLNRTPVDSPDAPHETTDRSLPRAITDSRTVCPLRARSDGKSRRFTVTQGQADTSPTCVRLAQQTRTQSLLKQRVVGSNPAWRTSLAKCCFPSLKACIGQSSTSSRLPLGCSLTMRLDSYCRSE